MISPEHAALTSYFDSLSPAARELFYDQLNAYLDSQPMGDRVKALAMNKKLGLGFASATSAAIGAGLTTLATTALTVGVGLYDKKKERQDAANSEKREYAAMAKQAEAEAKRAKAAAKARSKMNVTYVKYALWGVAGLSVLGLVGVVVMRRR